MTALDKFDRQVRDILIAIAKAPKYSPEIEEKFATIDQKRIMVAAEELISESRAEATVTSRMLWASELLPLVGPLAIHALDPEFPSNSARLIKEILAKIQAANDKYQQQTTEQKSD